MADDTTIATETEAAAASTDEPVAATGELVEETLIEEISIDGMCGVY